MGYYRGGDCMYGRGDYYRGDYYRGDPGSIFSGIGKAIGGVARAVGGLGIPVVSGVARTVGQIISPTKPAVASPPMPVPTSRTVIRPDLPFVPSFLEPSLDISRYGFGPPQIGAGQAGVPAVPLTPQTLALCGIRGMRLNKSTYITRGGGTSRWPPGLIVHPKGTECVKSRRMNVANPRALRRAVRRAQGFAKMARRVLSFVSAKAPKGRARFRKKK